MCFYKEKIVRNSKYKYSMFTKLSKEQLQLTYDTKFAHTVLEIKALLLSWSFEAYYFNTTTTTTI